ncbi:uncharacterized protein LOC110407718 isoform X2 [Numida meleagris]|nr:uncharacterized protein LOC110407718 isoform X2 [Numida meleagris]XP_021271369.1 uncharacterized protein LOC110407718 isoform X2 [Numida meleagris]XP_021271370.1 uncharacterized protein LOC110407718 isoform X2 [Numida meleagris]
MASMLQNVKATMGLQRHQLLADFDENESPVPDKFKRKASLSSLNTICMSLRKRIPLKQVELNFHETPLWENMEARKKSQVLQSITKTARNAFGTVSQKIQKTCQSPVHSTATFPAEDIGSSSATSFSKKRRTVQTLCPSMNSVTPAAGSKCTPRSSKRSLLRPARASEHTELRGFPSWHGEDAVPLSRSRRASAALKSPYSSPTPASRRTEIGRELELVTSGIRQLKHLFSAPDDGIVQGERQHAISNYYYSNGTKFAVCASILGTSSGCQKAREETPLNSWCLDVDGYK